MYKAKYTAPQNEKAAVLSELAAHERATEHYFGEMETFLLFAHRLSAVFANGWAGAVVDSVENRGFE